MIIQCEQCQTRFRLADEKLKPEGIKVRCSKCKHIFRVSPSESPQQPSPPEEPAPTPEPPPPPPPGPAEEVDFGAFNMEPEEEGREEPPEGPEIGETKAPPGGEQPAPAEAGETEETPIDRASLEPGAFDFEEDEGQADGGTAFDFGDEEEIVFEDEPALPPVPPQAESAGAVPESEEFVFEDEDAHAAEQDGKLLSGPQADTQEESFAFEKEEPFGDSAEEEFSFGDDYSAPDEFSWEKEEAEAEPEDFTLGKPASSAEGDLDFGEIPLGGSGGEQEEAADLAPDPSLVPDSQKSGRGEPPPQRERPPSPAPQPEAGRRSPLRGVLLLLLLVLGGAAGYWYWQQGKFDPAALLGRLTGRPPAVMDQEQIGIASLSGFYVNNPQAGQLFVINGRAVNQYRGERSALKLRGKLYDAGGRVVREQTAFAGNAMSRKTLADWPYAKIQEAMNNQFGDSLSNLNVASGKSVPFTIVFSDLPADLAEFTVEPAGSQPGSR